MSILDMVGHAGHEWVSAVRVRISVLVPDIRDGRDQPHDYARTPEEAKKKNAERNSRYDCPIPHVPRHPHPLLFLSLSLPRHLCPLPSLFQISH